MAEINGLPPKIWWEKLLHEMVMGECDLTTEEALDKYVEPTFWRQDMARVIDRDMLRHHCEHVRNKTNVNEIEVVVRHANFDGEYFAADHTVAGPGGKTGRYEIEVLTFARITNGRAAWIRELYWSSEGEETSWTDEFENYVAPAGMPEPAMTE